MTPLDRLLAAYSRRIDRIRLAAAIRREELNFLGSAVVDAPMHEGVIQIDLAHFGSRDLAWLRAGLISMDRRIWGAALAEMSSAREAA